MGSKSWRTRSRSFTGGAGGAAPRATIVNAYSNVWAGAVFKKRIESTLAGIAPPDSRWLRRSLRSSVANAKRSGCCWIRMGEAGGQRLAFAGSRSRRHRRQVLCFVHNQQVNVRLNLVTRNLGAGLGIVGSVGLTTTMGCPPSTAGNTAVLGFLRARSCSPRSGASAPGRPPRRPAGACRAFSRYRGTTAAADSSAVRAVRDFRIERHWFCRKAVRRSRDRKTDAIATSAR